MAQQGGRLEAATDFCDRSALRAALLGAVRADNTSSGIVPQPHPLEKVSKDIYVDDVLLKD